MDGGKEGERDPQDGGCTWGEPDPRWPPASTCPPPLNFSGCAGLGASAQRSQWCCLREAGAGGGRSQSLGPSPLPGHTGPGVWSSWLAVQTHRPQAWSLPMNVVPSGPAHRGLHPVPAGPDQTKPREQTCSALSTPPQPTCLPSGVSWRGTCWLPHWGECAGKEGRVKRSEGAALSRCCPDPPAEGPSESLSAPSPRAAPSAQPKG